MKREPTRPWKSQKIRLLRYSDPRGYQYAVADIDELTPDPETFRISVHESSLNSILALVADDADGLYTLARDIVKMGGVNPAELLSVSRVGSAFVVKATDDSRLED